MRMVDLIEKKRDGNELSTKEIDYIITNYTSGNIPDYQISALLMTIFYQDMTDREITDLTLAIAHSGDVIDLIESIRWDQSRQTFDWWCGRYDNVDLSAVSS